MITLALDPGIAACAWAILDAREVLATGVVVTKRDRSLSVTADARRRIVEIITTLDEVGSEYRPSRCVAEAFTVQRAGQMTWAAAQTLRLLGRLEEWAETRAMTYEELTTQSVKARLGVPNGSKADVQRRVLEATRYELPGTKQRREHVADAIAVGLTIDGKVAA